MEIGFVLVLSIMVITLIAQRGSGIITQPGSRSNTSVKRTRTGGADLLVFFGLRTPVRAAYLGR